MVAEGIFLIALYQLYLVPRVISPAVVDHWLKEIESGRINLPQVLESYTGELIGNIDALLFGFTDQEGLGVASETPPVAIYRPGIDRK